MQRRTTTHSVRRMPKIYGNRVKRHFDWRPLFRVARLTLGAAVPTALVIVVAMHPSLRIEQVAVEGAVFVGQQQVLDAIPRGGHMLATSRDGLSQLLLRQLPELDQVRITWKLPSQAVVSIRETPPVLLWVSGNQVSLLSEQGEVLRQYPKDQLATLPQAPAALLAGLPRIDDPTGLPLTVGQSVGGPQFSAAVRAILRELASNLPTATFELDHLELGETSYDVVAVSKGGMRVYFDTESDAGVQVRNLARLIAQGKAGGTNTVDLRVDRWAYVR